MGNMYKHAATTSETKSSRDMSRDEHAPLLDSHARAVTVIARGNVDEAGFNATDELQGSPTVAIFGLMLGKDD